LSIRGAAVAAAVADSDEEAELSGMDDGTTD
jgi:hypothetical protein